MPDEITLCLFELALRAGESSRVTNAFARCHPIITDTVGVGAAPGRNEIAPGRVPARHRVDVREIAVLGCVLQPLHTRSLTSAAAVRSPRRQRCDRQRCGPPAFEVRAQLRRCLERRLRVHSGSGDIAGQHKHVRQTSSSDEAVYDISGCVGLGENSSKHGNRFAKIALLEGSQGRTPVPTEAREEGVAGSPSQPPPFFAGGARRNWITPEDGDVRLPAEDLAESPLIAQLSRQAQRLFDVRVHCLGVERGRRCRMSGRGPAAQDRRPPWPSQARAQLVRCGQSRRPMIQETLDRRALVRRSRARGRHRQQYPQ